MRKPSLLIIFLTVFIDLIGFGIVMPLLPIYGEKFGAYGFRNGAIVASFSIMQFVFAPMWGRLSDRIGRRPVLLISNLGSAASYALFAVAANYSGDKGFYILLFSRIFAGIAGANLSVASAYIADVSPPEKRTRSMGLIGMAFGLGFILGPTLGSRSAKAFGLAGPGWVAAAICFANFLLGFFILAESLKASTEKRADRVRFAQWAHTLAQPTVGFCVGLYFFATFSFAAFEVTVGRLLESKFGYDETRIGDFITYCGLLSALIQGGGIKPIVRMLGERRLISVSLVLTAVGLVMIPYVNTLTGLLVALGIFAAGSGLHRPPLFGLISMHTPEHEQGATMGVTQSSSSLARILAPVSAAMLYEIRADIPYVACAVIAILASIVAWIMLVNRAPKSGKTG